MNIFVSSGRRRGTRMHSSVRPINDDTFSEDEWTCRLSRSNADESIRV
jgi:hypothetical protein